MLHLHMWDHRKPIATSCEIRGRCSVPASVLLGAWAALAYVEAHAQGFPQVDQAVQAISRVVVLSPQKSVSIDALKKFEQALGNDTAQEAERLSLSAPPVPVFVHSGDTLEGILKNYWGLQPGADYQDLKPLLAQILALPENAKLAARSKTALIIQPGDRLYLPNVIFGHSRSGPLVIPAIPNADVQSSLKQFFPDAFAASAQVINEGSEPPIAALATEAPCNDPDAVEPYDSRALAERLQIVQSRPVRAWSPGGDIAVIDAGLSGNMEVLVPFFSKASGNDQYKSEGGGVYIPLGSGRNADLLSKTQPPSQHGTHIMTLALGGINQLAGGTPASVPWKLIPVIVEGAKVTSSGDRIAEMRPDWITMGVQYAQERHPRIINMSLETQQSQYLATAMIPDKSRLYVVSAGNGKLQITNPNPPPIKIAANDFELMRTNYDQRVNPGFLGGPQRSHIVSVAAYHRSNGEGLEPFTLVPTSGHYYRSVDIAAPGACIRSYSSLGDSLPSSTPIALSGTSQAAAIVSYAATLVTDMLGAEWTPADVKARLLASSVYYNSRENDLSSSGRLSIEAAVALRFDIVRYRENGKVMEEIGDFADLPKPIRDVFMCDSRLNGEPPT